MSGLIVGLVLKLPIMTEFTSEHKFTAAIYAEHAWEDGTHAYPSILTVSQISGYSERSVQRYVRTLESLGLLVSEGKGPRGTNRYRFPLKDDAGKFWLDVGWRGVTVTPRQADTLGGDRDSGDRDSGVTGVTRSIKPSLVTKEEEEEGQAAKFSISPELKAELEQAGIYRSVWRELEILFLSRGWSESDVVAVIDWQIHINAGKPSFIAQRIVARMREGTKAPKKYYAFYSRQVEDRWYPGKSTDEPVGLLDQLQQLKPMGVVQDFELSVPRISPTSEIYLAWMRVLTELARDSSRSAFQHIKDTHPILWMDQTLHVACADEFQREFCTSRFKSIVERTLVGILKEQVSVHFAVPLPVAVETEKA